MEQVFCIKLQNPPEDQPLETAMRPKRMRRRIPAVVAKKPRSTRSTSGRKKTSRKPAVSLSPHNRPTAEPPISNIDTVPSTACDCISNMRRSLRDDEIFLLLNYGSEEESGEEEEWVTQSGVVPRVANLFLNQEDEKIEGGVTINLDWPPQDVCQFVSDQTHAAPAPDWQIPMEPSDKFEWRALSTLQIEPHLRREPFSQITGPTVSFKNPYEAFTVIWDCEIMDVIVRETNIYAHQLRMNMSENGTICPKSRITRWQDTNVNELYTYLAIVLAMGIVVKSRLEEYWKASKDIFSTPGFSTVMSFHRFNLLSKCLHFNNNRNCDSSLLTPSQAKVFKIQPLLDHLNAKFSQLYNLSQNVALVESPTMREGWLHLNPFDRNKAATVGIKTYEVCEPQTGYSWRFEVHAGHDTSAVQEDDPVSGIVPALVLRLLNNLEHKGHTIWVDNLHSPALARKLKARGLDCVGTIRTNCQFVPLELANVEKKDIAVGQVFGCTSGDVNLIVCRDKNCVAFASTYHGPAITKCGHTLKPTVVQDYNVCMGGVDRKDQHLAMYPIETRRTRVWYKIFFRKLLNASVLNSYILLNKNWSLSHRKFRKTLVLDLLSACRTPSPNAPTPAVVHSPAQYNLIRTGKPYRLKRQCAVCKTRTTTYCKACNVPMCVFTCYEPYHTSSVPFVRVP